MLRLFQRRRPQLNRPIERCLPKRCNAREPAPFAWKHDENPFGQSPARVAEDDSGTLVGLRTFLRWRFRRPDGRPGYLRMGWQQVGKVPVSVRLTGPRSIAKLAGCGRVTGSAGWP